jgi:2-methylcitrate dehydratase PrpD
LALVGAFSGREQCTVVGTDMLASPETAALANGMFSHAYESDDSHGFSSPGSRPSLRRSPGQCEE